MVPVNPSAASAGGASASASASASAVSSGSGGNRKWVSQMTRRIRDLMSSGNMVEPHESASSAAPYHQQHHHHQHQHQHNSHHHQQQHESSSPPSNDSTGVNFGLALDKCESSSFSPVIIDHTSCYFSPVSSFNSSCCCGLSLQQYIPVVVEICTRLIELHVVDEGLYRKVGQKQVVTALRAQLNAGILHVDTNDFNWDNPHAVVSLFKCFLNELPDALTTSRKATARSKLIEYTQTKQNIHYFLLRTCCQICTWTSFRCVASSTTTSGS